MMTTAERKVARHAEHVRAGQVVRSNQLEIPAIDTWVLEQQNAPGRPRPMYGTFKAPIDLSAERWETMRNKKVQAWLEFQLKNGWNCILERRIQVDPGIYPARDLEGSKDLWDQREYVIGAWFYPVYPVLERIEIDPELTAPRLS